MIRTRPICPHCKQPMRSYREHLIGGRTILEFAYIDEGGGSWRGAACPELIDGDAGPEKPRFEYQCGECGEWLDGEPDMPTIST